MLLARCAKGRRVSTKAHTPTAPMCQGGGGRRADQNRNSPSRSRDSRGPFFPHLDGAGSSGRRSKSTSPESAPVSNTTSTRLSMCVSGQRGWHCVCIAERPEVDTLLTGGLDTTIHQHQLAGLDLAFRLMLAAQGHRKARHRSAAQRSGTWRSWNSVRSSTRQSPSQ